MVRFSDIIGVFLMVVIAILILAMVSCSPRPVTLYKADMQGNVTREYKAFAFGKEGRMVNPDITACVAKACVDLAGAEDYEIEKMHRALASKTGGIEAVPAMEYGKKQGWWSSYHTVSTSSGITERVRAGNEVILFSPVLEGMETPEYYSGFLVNTSNGIIGYHAYRITYADKPIFGEPCYTISNGEGCPKIFMWRTTMDNLLARGAVGYYVTD
jgi:hypothetical protein